MANSSFKKEIGNKIFLFAGKFPIEEGSERGLEVSRTELQARLCLPVFVVVIFKDGPDI